MIIILLFVGKLFVEVAPLDGDTELGIVDAKSDIVKLLMGLFVTLVGKTVVEE